LNRVAPLLSKAMLLLGGLLMMAGLGWAVWRWADALPPTVETEAGAVVLAITATHTPSPEPTAMLTPSPTVPPEPTPVLGPTKPQSQASPSPTAVPATPTSLTPSPILTATPTPQPPTRIVAPAIGLDAPVVAMGWKTVEYKGQKVVEWDVPKDAAGWHVNSAFAGQPGNTVLSGHHNIEGKVFRYVVDLEIGDEVILYAGDRAFAYTVTEKYILREAGMPWAVRQKNAQWIAPTADERLTLVTCWPYEWPGNTHRVIVVAKPRSDPERREGEE
jgi:sortase A